MVYFFKKYFCLPCRPLTFVSLIFLFILSGCKAGSLKSVSGDARFSAGIKTNTRTSLAVAAGNVTTVNGAATYKIKFMVGYNQMGPGFNYNGATIRPSGAGVIREQ